MTRVFKIADERGRFYPFASRQDKAWFNLNSFLYFLRRYGHVFTPNTRVVCYETPDVNIAIGQPNVPASVTTNVTYYTIQQVLHERALHATSKKDVTGILMAKVGIPKPLQKDYTCFIQIYNPKTEMYSEGGYWGWSKTGKIWGSIGALRRHLSAARRRTRRMNDYADCYVIAHIINAKPKIVETQLDHAGSTLTIVEGATALQPKTKVFRISDFI